MSQSPFYLEHYLDSLETLPGELRRNFTKMTDKDVMNKDIMVQIDGASDDYLRKVRDLSPTKRKAEMEKIQVRLVVGWIVGCYCGGDHTRTGDWAVKRAPRRESESTQIHPAAKNQYFKLRRLLNSVCHHFLLGVHTAVKWYHASSLSSTRALLNG